MGGARRHEVFAFLWEEVEGPDFDTEKWQLDTDHQVGPEAPDNRDVLNAYCPPALSVSAEKLA